MLNCDYGDPPHEVIDKVNEELRKAGFGLRFENRSGDNSWYTFRLVRPDGGAAVSGDETEEEDDE